jgi:spore germination cell wall hydrolase CwlJ-like protein
MHHRAGPWFLHGEEDIARDDFALLDGRRRVRALPPGLIHEFYGDGGDDGGNGDADNSWNDDDYAAFFGMYDENAPEFDSDYTGWNDDDYNAFFGMYDENAPEFDLDFAPSFDFDADVEIDPDAPAPNANETFGAGMPGLAGLSGLSGLAGSGLGGLTGEESQQNAAAANAAAAAAAEAGAPAFDGDWTGLANSVTQSANNLAALSADWAADYGSLADESYNAAPSFTNTYQDTMAGFAPPSADPASVASAPGAFTGDLSSLANSFTQSANNLAALSSTWADDYADLLGDENVARADYLAMFDPMPTARQVQDDLPTLSQVIASTRDAIDDRDLAQSPFALGAPTSAPTSALVGDLAALAFDPTPVSEQQFSLTAPSFSPEALADATLGRSAVTSSFDTFNAPSMPTSAFTGAQSGVFGDLGLRGPAPNEIQTDLRNEDNPLDRDIAREEGIPGLTIGGGFRSDSTYGFNPPAVDLVDINDVPASVRETTDAALAQSQQQAAPQQSDGLPSLAEVVAATQMQADDRDRADEAAIAASRADAEQQMASPGGLPSLSAPAADAPQQAEEQARETAAQQQQAQEEAAAQQAEQAIAQALASLSAPAGAVGGAPGEGATAPTSPGQAAPPPPQAFAPTPQLPPLPQWTPPMGRNPNAVADTAPGVGPAVGERAAPPVAPLGPTPGLAPLAPLTEDRREQESPAQQNAQQAAQQGNPRARYAGQPAPESEVRALARAMLGEARGEGPQGMAAVGSVISNRAAVNYDNFGRTVEAQVNAPRQFDLARDRNARAAERAMNTPLGRQATQMARDILEGRALDPTRGAVAFRNPQTAARSSWHANLERNGAVDIGQHRFSDFRNAAQMLPDSPPMPPARPDDLPPLPQGNVPSAPRPAGQIEINDITSRADPRWSRFGPIDKVEGVVFHHTAGRPTVAGTIQTFKDRGFPAHFIIDREGRVHQALPITQQGRHTRSNDDLGLSNANTLGVEVIARNDSDITPAQVQAAQRLHAQLGLSPGQAFAHGEINAHKQPTEGVTIANAIRAGAPVAAAQTPASATTAPAFRSDGSLGAYRAQAAGDTYAPGQRGAFGPAAAASGDLPALAAAPGDPRAPGMVAAPSSLIASAGQALGSIAGSIMGGMRGGVPGAPAWAGPAPAPFQTTPVQPGKLPDRAPQGAPVAAAPPTPEQIAEGARNTFGPPAQQTPGLPSLADMPLMTGPRGREVAAAGPPAPAPTFEPRSLTIPASGPPQADRDPSMDAMQVGPRTSGPDFQQLVNPSTIFNIPLGMIPGFGPLNTLTRLATGRDILTNLFPDARAQLPEEFGDPFAASGNGAPRLPTQSSPAPVVAGSPYNYSPPTANPAWMRVYRPLTSDPRRYGFGSEHTFFEDNRGKVA